MIRWYHLVAMIAADLGSIALVLYLAGLGAIP